MERPRSIARRQGPRAELCFRVQLAGVASPFLFFSSVRGVAGPCWSACALRQILGSHPANGSFKVSWELRKSRVNQQQELSPTRFTTGGTWFSAWWGPRAFLPSASERAAQGHSLRQRARRTGRVRVTDVLRQGKTFLRPTPLLSARASTRRAVICVGCSAARARRCRCSVCSRGKIDGRSCRAASWPGATPYN